MKSASSIVGSEWQLFSDPFPWLADGDDVHAPCRGNRLNSRVLVTAAKIKMRYLPIKLFHPRPAPCADPSVRFIFQQSPSFMKFFSVLSAAFAFTLLGAVSAVAQGRNFVVPPPHPPRPLPPVIWIDPSQGKLKPMEMQAFDADIRVRGHLATTTIEMTFYNPNSRVLEGELVFPLGEGQTIAGYALEVSGKMRQAVVVEKQKGREVFEDVVRRGVDPGLAEITKGNVFRTRVYPLPPMGTKRVTVSFEQELGSMMERAFAICCPWRLRKRCGYSMHGPRW